MTQLQASKKLKELYPDRYSVVEIQIRNYTEHSKKYYELYIGGGIGRIDGSSFEECFEKLDLYNLLQANVL